MPAFSLPYWLIHRRSHTFFLGLPNAELAFGKYFIVFNVNVGFSGEGTSQVVGEIIVRFQWLVIREKVSLLRHISRCMLVHDLSTVDQRYYITKILELGLGLHAPRVPG